MVDMPIRTTAVEAAAARGWSKAELGRRTGLSLATIYNMARGEQPSAKAIEAIMRVFADLPYERLFVVADSSMVELASSKEEPVIAA
jgi:transcriptional regulator with XRE-family HTH domain